MSHHDDYSQHNGGKVAKKLGGALANQGKKAAGKVVSKVAQNIGKKLAQKGIKTLLIKTAPYWGAALIIILLFVVIMSIFIPNAEEEDVQSYAGVASELSISFYELLAFDMVLHGNDLEGIDPNESAYHFIRITYEEFEPSKVECVVKEDGICKETRTIPEKVTKTREYQGKDEIKSFFTSQGLRSGSIADKMASVNKNANKRIIVSQVTAQEAMEDAGFSEDDKQYFYEILASGQIEELYPSYGQINIIPGTCVGSVSANGVAKVNATVQGYTETIKKYAIKYGVEPYVEVIKAMMMAESGGKGNDPMQASESGVADLEPKCRGKKGAARIGCIKDPEMSINVGVQVFANTMKLANYDIAVGIQTYNFGSYFATWIKSHGGTYSIEIAEEYSRTVMAAAGQGLGTPSHAQKILSKYYQDTGCVAGDVSPSIVGANGWVWPTKSTRITSGFGYRSCSGCSSYHDALDVGAMKQGVAGDPVWSIADGVVIQSGLITNGGNAVYVDHGGGIVTRYIHLDSRSVSKGQRVTKGQIIGTMGGTGGTKTQLVKNAYAVHLDFQLKINGSPVDPSPYFPSLVASR